MLFLFVGRVTNTNAVFAGMPDLRLGPVSLMAVATSLKAASFHQQLTSALRCARPRGFCSV